MRARPLRVQKSRCPTSLIDAALMRPVSIVVVRPPEKTRRSTLEWLSLRSSTRAQTACPALLTRTLGKAAQPAEPASQW